MKAIQAATQRRPFGSPSVALGSVVSDGCVHIELPGPALQLPMDGRRAHQRLAVQDEVGWVEQERTRLRPAHAAVAAHQLLEGGHLLQLRVEGAVDEQVADVGEGIQPAHVVRGALPEEGQRILALDAIVIEVVNAAGADHERRPRRRGP